MKIREERLFTARKSYKSNFPALVSKLFCTEKSARNFDLRNIPVEKSHSNIIFIPWPIQSQKDTKKATNIIQIFSGLTRGLCFHRKKYFPETPSGIFSHYWKLEHIFPGWLLHFHSYLERVFTFPWHPGYEVNTCHDLEFWEKSLAESHIPVVSANDFPQNLPMIFPKIC